MLLCGTCYAQQINDRKLSLQGNALELLPVDGGTLLLVEFNEPQAWAVYALQKTSADANEIIRDGFILPFKLACDVYPERNTWTYITAKQIRNKK